MLKNLSLGLDITLGSQGGTFVSPERNQSRGERVQGSVEFIPHVAEEEMMAKHGDPLRRFVRVDDIPCESLNPEQILLVKETARERRNRKQVA